MVQFQILCSLHCYCPFFHIPNSKLWNGIIILGSQSLPLSSAAHFQNAKVWTLSKYRKPGSHAYFPMALQQADLISQSLDSNFNGIELMFMYLKVIQMLRGVKRKFLVSLKQRDFEFQFPAFLIPDSINTIRSLGIL